jgi:hypothetical protein
VLKDQTILGVYGMITHVLIEILSLYEVLFVLQFFFLFFFYLRYEKCNELFPTQNLCENDGGYEFCVWNGSDCVNFTKNGLCSHVKTEELCIFSFEFRNNLFSFFFIYLYIFFIRFCYWDNGVCKALDSYENCEDFPTEMSCLIFSQEITMFFYFIFFLIFIFSVLKDVCGLQMGVFVLIMLNVKM